MTVQDLASNNDLKLLTEGLDLSAEITKPFCCDLLSIAMGKAPAGAAWVTVTVNTNTLAVATLTDVACIIFAEGCAVDSSLIEKAIEEEIPLFSTQLSSFDAAILAK
ncbi:MAG: hypothetical protein IKI20_05815 [Lachnospiraceae bacterium]|nr:hypothetical protein [Lachnospiraceae bacterium]